MGSKATSADEYQDQIAAHLALVADRLTEYATVARGLVLNNALYSNQVVFDASGEAQLSASATVASLMVINYGTLDVAVHSGPAQGSPVVSGPGSALVAPRSFVTLPMAGTVHSLYGRPGERCAVTALAQPTAPNAGQLGGGAPFFTVTPTAPWVNGVVYTRPWAASGLPAVYGGMNVRETAGAIATVRVHDRDINGALLHDLQISASASMEIELDHARLAPSGVIFLEVVAGTVEGFLAVR